MMSSDSNSKGGTGRGLPVGWGWREDEDGFAVRLYPPGCGSLDYSAAVYRDGSFVAYRDARGSDEIASEDRASRSSEAIAAAQREAEAALWAHDGFGVGEVRGRVLTCDQYVAVILCAPTALPGLPGVWRVTAVRPVEGGIEVDAVRAPATPAPIVVEAGKLLPVSFSALRAAGYEVAEPAPREPSARFHGCSGRAETCNGSISSPVQEGETCRCACHLDEKAPREPSAPTPDASAELAALLLALRPAIPLVLGWFSVSSPAYRLARAVELLLAERARRSRADAAEQFYEALRGRDAEIVALRARADEAERKLAAWHTASGTTAPADVLALARAGDALLDDAERERDAQRGRVAELERLYAAERGAVVAFARDTDEAHAALERAGVPFAVIDERADWAARKIVALRGRVDEQVKEIAGLYEQIDTARAKLRVASAGVEDVWKWAGDGEDHPESMGCPVVMSAETLREFVAATERAEALESRVEDLEKECHLRCAKCGAVAIGSDLVACRVCGNGDATAEETIVTLRASLAAMRGERDAEREISREQETRADAAEARVAELDSVRRALVERVEREPSGASVAGLLARVRRLLTTDARDWSLVRTDAAIYGLVVVGLVDPARVKRNAGARGLRAILEAAMLEIMYDVPSRPGIKEVVITADVIEKGEGPITVYEKEAEMA